MALMKFVSIIKRHVWPTVMKFVNNGCQIDTKPKLLTWILSLYQFSSGNFPSCTAMRHWWPKPDQTDNTCNFCTFKLIYVWPELGQTIMAVFLYMVVECYSLILTDPLSLLHNSLPPLLMLYWKNEKIFKKKVDGRCAWIR